MTRTNGMKFRLEKIWAEPVFKDVSMFSLLLLLLLL